MGERGAKSQTSRMLPSKTERSGGWYYRDVYVCVCVCLSLACVG